MKQWWISGLVELPDDFRDNDWSVEDDFKFQFVDQHGKTHIMKPRFVRAYAVPPKGRRMLADDLADDIPF